MPTKLTSKQLAEIRDSFTAHLPELGDVIAQYSDEKEKLLDHCTALEEELKKWQSELAEAAREIHCAGPVSHRIRVLKREHGAQLTKLQEELKAAQEENQRLVRGLSQSLSGDWKQSRP